MAIDIMLRMNTNLRLDEYYFLSIPTRLMIPSITFV
jgi:hypothetical protein